MGFYTNIWKKNNNNNYCKKFVCMVVVGEVIKNVHYNTVGFGKNGISIGQ